MSVRVVNYKKFIEENFLILDKKGLRKHFIFNDTQNFCWDILKREYPDMQGIRENWLKFRQPGLSSLIDGIFTADFILSALGKMPISEGLIVSHKEEETKTLFRRVEYFLDSFCLLNNIPKEKLIKKNESGTNLESHNSALLSIATAGAKVLGRGGTKQNIHWSEVAFYPNTPIMDASKLVPPAEEQVPMESGKIFREFTGNIMYDFAYEEYVRGKEGKSQFKSRFLGWWLHKEYNRKVPRDFVLTEQESALMHQFHIPLGQIAWRRWKVETAKDPDLARREYPDNDLEAFLSTGKQYFNSYVLREYEVAAKQPLQSKPRVVQAEPKPVPSKETPQQKLNRIVSNPHDFTA
jgi:hypothetical protein